jgi:hypothetical protein
MRENRQTLTDMPTVCRIPENPTEELVAVINPSNSPRHLREMRETKHPEPARDVVFRQTLLPGATTVGNPVDETFGRSPLQRVDDNSLMKAVSQHAFNVIFPGQ